jgi:Fe-S-cluster containining protein
MTSEHVEAQTESERNRRSRLCLKCLKCCHMIVFPTQYSEFDSFARELYEKRGWTVRAYKKKLWMNKEKTCRHLTPQGCTIYHTRPAACKIYDGRQDPAMRDECLWGKPEEVTNG